jgi:hypothetical protein
MPPQLVPQFFIGLESQKDGWANSALIKLKKILVMNMGKEEF